MPITTLPTAPSRADPTNFSDRADAFLTALPTFGTEANALQADVNSKQSIASAAASSATASASSAASTANCSIWISGTTYAIGDNRFSPINFLTYRRKTAGVSTIDPSLDATNWMSLTNNFSDINGGQLAGLRNKVINGNMGIAQRGTAAVTTNVYGPADRWRNDSLGSTFSTTQGKFVSGDTLFNNGGAQYFTTVAVTSVAGAGNYYALLQPMEDVTVLGGQTVTVSFWAKAASGTPSIGLELWQFFGTGGSPSATATGTGQAQALTTTWTKYSKTFTVPSLSGITLGTTENTSYTALSFWLDAGSSVAIRSGSIGQASKTISIAQVQLEIGSVATPFEQIPYGLSLQLCQRYYQRNPIATGAFGTTPSSYLDGRSYNPSTVSASVAITRYLPVVMRANPTVTFYYDIQDGATTGPSSPVSSNQGMFFFNAAVPTGNWIDLDDWQAVAEL